MTTPYKPNAINCPLYHVILQAIKDQQAKQQDGGKQK